MKRTTNSTRRPASGKHLRPRRVRLYLEPLESRQLLSTFDVDLFLDEDDGDTRPGDISLREAISLANFNNEDDVINLRAGTYELSLRGNDDDKNAFGDLDLIESGRSLTIRGQGADTTAITALGLFQRFQSELWGDRAIHVFPGVVATLEGLMITGGRNTIYGEDGGAVLNQGDLTILNSAVSGNIDYTTADAKGEWVDGSGGGISNAGRLNIMQSSVTGNQVIGLIPHPICLACPPSEFEAGEGGGVANRGALAVSNSTVSSNAAAAAGGVWNAGGEVALRNATVAANRDFGVVNADDGLVTASNSIIAGNSVGASGEVSGDFRGVLNSEGHNLIGSTYGAILTGNQEGNITGVDPQLGRLQLNGGATKTHALLPGSPAIDAGSDEASLSVDQRGAPRPQDGDGDGVARADMGAFELASPDGDMPPRVLSVMINDGWTDPPDLPAGPQPTNWRVQRSDLRNLSVVFSKPVIVSANDLRLINLGVDAPAEADTRIILEDGQLELLDHRLVIHFAPYELPDGVFQLEILPSVTDLDGRGLDGDADGASGGAFVMTGNALEGLAKLAGEFNGDGGVSVFDFPTFVYWFGKPTSRAPDYLDLNNDGGSSIFDFPLFVANFGRRLVFPPTALWMNAAELAFIPSPIEDSAFARREGVDRPSRFDFDSESTIARDEPLIDLLALYRRERRKACFDLSHLTP